MPGRPDSPATRALAWLYAPPPQRTALAALCALEREIGGSLRPGLDHQVAHAQLAWWREECVRCAQGRPQHPLTRELAALFAPSGREPLTGLAGFVDTATWDLAAATFATRPELTGYCERWSAAMIDPLAWLATRGAASDAAAAVCAPASTLGAKLREMELLLALARDARAGRLRLPLDELDAAQIASACVAQPPWPASLAALLRERHGQLRRALEASVAALAPHARTQLRGLIVWAAIVCGQSVRAERRLPNASAAHHPQRLSDGWRAWRAARRVDAGRGLAASGLLDEGHAVKLR
jgi:15-cis-phytoene synthase